MYFVTICSDERKNFFGKVVNEEMITNVLGKIIEKEWLKLKDRFVNIDLGNFIVMPNHLHGIIAIYEFVGAPLAGALNQGTVIETKRAGASPAPTLGDIIGSYKSLCFNSWKQYIKNNNLNCPLKFWQRNYYEHIIRNEKALEKISSYIMNNPYYWDVDVENISVCKNIPEKQREEYYKNIYAVE